MALVINQLSVRRVTAPDGEFAGTWWDVRLDLPWGYAGSIQAAMADAKGAGLMNASGLVIRALIKEWNVEIEPGKIAPITDEVIAQLPMKFVTYMVTDEKNGLMNFFSPRVTEDEEKLILLLSRGVPITGDLSDMELALMCEKFHVLPSQVMTESAYWMRRVFTLLVERDRANRKGKPKGKGK